MCVEKPSVSSKSELYGMRERKGKLRGKHLKSILQFRESSEFLLPLPLTLAGLWWLSWRHVNRLSFLTSLSPWQSYFSQAKAFAPVYWWLQFPRGTQMDHLSYKFLAMQIAASLPLIMFNSSCQYLRPGDGNGNPLQYNLMDREAWRATVMGSQRVSHDLPTEQ